jgi:hypothetical protein
VCKIKAEIDACISDLHLDIDRLLEDNLDYSLQFSSRLLRSQVAEPHRQRLLHKVNRLKVVLQHRVLQHVLHHANEKREGFVRL